MSEENIDRSNSILTLKTQCPWCRLESGDKNAFHFTGVCVHCRDKIKIIANEQIIEFWKDNKND